MTSRSRRRWTPAQVEILRAGYPAMRWRELLEECWPHNKGAITAKAYTLGIKRRRGLYERIRRPKMGPSPLIAVLVAERVARKWNRAQLAKRLGYPPCSIGRWERGVMAPNLRGLTAWCEALGFRLALERAGGG